MRLTLVVFQVILYKSLTVFYKIRYIPYVQMTQTSIFSKYIHFSYRYFTNNEENAVGLNKFDDTKTLASQTPLARGIINLVYCMRWFREIADVVATKMWWSG